MATNMETYGRGEGGWTFKRKADVHGDMDTYKNKMKGFEFTPDAPSGPMATYKKGDKGFTFTRNSAPAVKRAGGGAVMAPATPAAVPMANSSRNTSNIPNQ